MSRPPRTTEVPPKDCSRSHSCQPRSNLLERDQAVVRGPRHLAVRCGIALVLAGCGGPKAYVRPDFLDHPPRRVAVLPFEITYTYDLKAGESIPLEHTARRDVFRKTFYYAFTPLGYEDMKLSDVDAKLEAAWGSMTQGRWRSASPQELANALGVDALIYGEISRLSHFVSPLYTDTRLDASLRMVDATTGEVLWRKSVIAAERGGAAFQQGQVVDFLKDQVRSFQHGVKFRRVAEAVARQFVSDMPNPPMSATASSASQASRQELGAVRLAILPFQAKRADWEKGAEALRADLVVSLQESPFDTVELHQIDAALRQHGWSEGQLLPANLSLATLAHDLGADLLLRGTVTNWGRGYAVLESWVKAELQLELIDPASGEVLWSEQKKNTRQAGIFKVPAGYKAIVTAPIAGMRTSHLERVASHLGRAMVQDLSTSPAVMAYLSERKKESE